MLLSTGDAVALFEDDLAEPGRESTRVLQVGQAEISLDEGFLRSILCQLEVTEQRVCIPDCHVVKLLDDTIKRRQIPLLGQDDLLLPTIRHVSVLSNESLKN